MDEARVRLRCLAIRRAARQVVEATIEVEVQELISQYSNMRTLTLGATRVRNGYLPAHEILTPVRAVEARVPKMRGRSGAALKFNSALVPPYAPLVDPQSAKGPAAAMIAYALDPALRARHGAQTRQRAVGRFGLDLVTHAYQALYTSLLLQRGLASPTVTHPLPEN